MEISQLRSGWYRPGHGLRPEGTPDSFRPFRTVPHLTRTPGTLCRANFQCRFATTLKVVAGVGVAPTEAELMRLA